MMWGMYTIAPAMIGTLVAVAPVAAQIAPQGPTPAGASQSLFVARTILHDIQPCANRQTNPGPGAERIVVTMALHLARDGGLAEPPRILGHGGVNADNERYVGQVDAHAIASVVECAPLRGLPAELYDAPNGWSHFTMRYTLPG
jgi:hypothetical protein